MARIRTIKPEFFTSEDIVQLSPLARLLYIATWCEADREGRLEWKPRTLKLRYLPGDDCDIDALASELVEAGLIVLYGDGLAFIPGFGKHQHVNPRESASTLPEPEVSARVSTRHDASARVNSRIDPQVGKERKGKEGKEYVASGDAAPSRAKTITLATYLANCAEADVDAIPADDPIYAWAASVSLPVEYLELAWAWFKAKYGPGGDRASKRYTDWRAVFRNAVKDNWGRLWAIDSAGQYFLTTAGKQAKMAQNAV